MLTLSGTAENPIGLPYCDELEAEDGSSDGEIGGDLEDEDVDGPGNVTDVDTPLPSCPAPPAPPVMDAVRFIRACGLELHWGATLLQRRMPSPHAGVPTTAPNAAATSGGGGGGGGGGALPTLPSSWLRLTSGVGSVGTAWYSAPLPLRAGFDTSFTFQWLQVIASDCT